MKKVLKVVGIILLVLVVLIIGTIFYLRYHITHIKDSHDLQAQVDAIGDDFIQKKFAPGICVGIVKGNTVMIKGYGTADKNGGQIPDSNTIFEIGSITKVFTAEITQRLVDDGLLHWNDHIQAVLPDSAKLKFDDSSTLLNLVNHTSGFARIPDSILSLLTNECDPYSTLTNADIARYLRACTDKKRPDLHHYDYSNFGTALLANIDEYRTGKSYETLLQELICFPLQMVHTSLFVKDSSKFATGYDEKGNKTCHWNFGAMYGCGAIRSDIADMIKFLKANMDSTNLLYNSFHKTHQETALIPTGGIAYGWHIDRVNGALSGIFNIIWHNGGTGGFRSYMGFDPKRKTGIIVIANQATDEVDRAGIDILIKACTTSWQ